MSNEKGASKAGKALAKLGAAKGGEARAAKLTQQERSEIARKAVQARWAREKGYQPIVLVRDDVATTSGLPTAKYKGALNLLDVNLPCYVLDNGQRVIGRTATTEMLSGFKFQGDLEGYLRSQNLKPFLDIDLVVANMVSFRLPEVEQLGREVKGLPADLLIEICQSLVAAFQASQEKPPKVKLTPRQIAMAAKASMFLAACAKVGLDALIDEATGYQVVREEDALQVKLRAYLEKEMRKWEKTFPDELWLEFGRLTNWHGSVTSRPKYWGSLVMALVYEYLDKDVAVWLKENAPKPQKGQNYHQWLTSQYGLRKLVEHIWMLVGISRTCHNMDELKLKMEQMFGKGKFQYDLFIRVPAVATLPVAASRLLTESQ
ncbi:MAG TPA: P63C domain-containing protein [Candidatus Acidoferrales bacterium]|nr:P63C domain-containing protein [Candidatus Acidoferrales bacterium]